MTIYKPASGNMIFQNSSGTQVGNFVTGGAWTLGIVPGSGGNALTHFIQADGAVDLRLRSALSTENAEFRIYQGATPQAFFSVVGTANSIITGSAVGDLCVRANNNVLFGISTTKIGGFETSGRWTLGFTGGGNHSSHLVEGPNAGSDFALTLNVNKATAYGLKIGSTVASKRLPYVEHFRQRNTDF